MEASYILQAIDCVLSGVNINEAQQWLLQNTFSNGYCVQLMIIADDRVNTFFQRQFALTELNRAIKYNWNHTNPQMRISQVDKQLIKDNMIEAIIRADDQPQLHKIFKEIIYNLILLQFPLDWSDLLQKIFGKLQSSTQFSEQKACLMFLQKIFQAFQFDQNEKQMENLQIQCLPILEIYFSKQCQNYNEENAIVVKYLLRIYHSCIILNMSQYLCQPQQVENWLQYVNYIYEFQLPQHLQDPINIQNIQEITLREGNLMWKNKKWCGRITNIFFSRYSQTIFAKTQEQQNVVSIFRQKFQEQIIFNVLKTIFQQSNYQSVRDIHYCFKNLIQALKNKDTFQLILPSIDQILSDICFYIMQYNESDVSCFWQNPEEFLQREDDLSLYEINNRNVVIDFIEVLSPLKDQNQQIYLYKLIQYQQQCLQNKIIMRTNSPSTPLTDQYQYGVFLCFGRLKDIIFQDDYLINQLENMIQSYILPELQNQNPILRYISCWVLGKYSDIEYKNKELIQNIVQGLYLCFQDFKFMPVQVMSGIALECMLHTELALDIVKNKLQNIIEIYLQIINSTQNEGLVQALDGLISAYQDEIQPYAISITKSLVSQFQGQIENSNKERLQDEQNEELVQSGHYLKAILKIIDSPLQQDLILQIEGLILPVINHILYFNIEEMMEETLEILNLLVYKQNSPSESLWFYFPYFVYSLTGIPQQSLQQLSQFNQNIFKQLLEKNQKGIGVDQIGLYSSHIKNFISKGDQFITRSDFFGYKLIDILMSSIDKLYNESDQMYKSQILQFQICLIEHNKGKIDNYVNQILNQTIERILILKNQKQTYLLSQNFNIINICFWYNAEFSINLLEQKQITHQFFTDLYQNMEHFKTESQKQYVLYGLSGLISLQDRIPQSISKGVGIIMKWIVKLTNELFSIQDKDEILDESVSDLAEDEEQAEMQYKNTLKLLEKYNNENDEDDDYDEGEIEQAGPGYEYDSPLDQANPILKFEETLLFIQQTNQQYFNQLLNTLDEVDKQNLKINFEKAKKKKDKE